MAAAAGPGPAPRLIAAVAFIDRLDRPLYFRAFPLAAAASAEHDPSALELAVFAALDYIHEKTANTLSGPARPAALGRAAAAANSDLFLNLLVSRGGAVRGGSPRRARHGGAGTPAARHHHAAPRSAAARRVQPGSSIDARQPPWPGARCVPPTRPPARPPAAPARCCSTRTAT